MHSNFSFWMMASCFYVINITCWATVCSPFTKVISGIAKCQYCHNPQYGTHNNSRRRVCSWLGGSLSFNRWMGILLIIFGNKTPQMISSVTWGYWGISWSGLGCGATLIMNRCCGCVAAVNAAVKGTDHIGGCSQLLFAFILYHIPVITTTFWTEKAIHRCVVIIPIKTHT